MEYLIKNPEDMDFTPLIENIKTLIKEIQDGEYHDDNDWHYRLYESAISCVCKEDFFDWMNKNI